ncbi:MAG: DUF1540 domain-containing protein [Bacillota bacterium]|jgi:hypothetical protein|nr:DUF1540 domain-containing protein [Bacillota bacterium]NLJ02238.1 DUF1540 domain-containing protein [Bacillota bacterium]
MEVHCTVKNCRWWDKNYCIAQAILITSDELGEALPESYDYQQTQSIVQQYGETAVDSCTATCCKTFVAADG